MSEHHGSFIWYELMTADPARAAAFYQAVHGWETKSSGVGAVEYHEITAADGAAVGGMLALTDEMIAGGAAPGWFGYVCVDDVDAELAALKAAGGAGLMDQTVPGVGRMALVADPQGIPIYLMAPQPPEGGADAVSTAFSADPGAVGHVAWNELTTPDPAGAKAWYLERFGWRHGGAMPMPGLGEYEFFRRGDVPLGAIMPRPEGQRAGWTFYWRTGDIDAAKARVEAAGGTPLHDIQQVPGGDYVLTCTDPEGAVFGLVGSRG
ncbi:VOC family protein [Sphingosinithalassobacter sp. LHW66-3]|uniref:VOC family protein n=1 Tax=Sphingosinithalassobacter sp. LHW66-3 TaxID=3424718 RepID=UPI003D6A2BB0